MALIFVRGVWNLKIPSCFLVNGGHFSYKTLFTIVLNWSTLKTEPELKYGYLILKN